MKLMSILLLTASVACAAPRLTETEKLGVAQRATESWNGTTMTQYKRHPDGTIDIGRNGKPWATAKKTGSGYLVTEKDGSFSTINQRATESWNGTTVTQYKRYPDGTVEIWRNGKPWATAKKTSSGYLVIEKDGSFSTINL